MPLRRVLPVLIFLCPWGLSAQPAPLPPPVIVFEEQALVASGVTPGGKVVWFGVAREVEDYSASVVRRDQVTADEDGDGKVRFELDRPVPALSVWIAVDLASGVWTAATPQGSYAREMPQPGRNPDRGEPGRPEWVETGRRYLEMAVVRPGEGVWALTLGDGGGDDGDGQVDGRITATLARMRALGGGPGAPDRFSPGDVVAVVDPNRMEYSVETLARPRN